jgi:hypothetical protein
MAAARPSQIATNALYVNIAACQSTIFDENGNNAAWVTTTGVGAPAGVLLSAGQTFRDMGKTVYLPSPTTPNAIAMQSTILRKVQWIPSGSFDFYGIGGAAGSVGTEFFTGYIPLGGQTYAGGGASGTCVFARAN